MMLPLLFPREMGVRVGDSRTGHRDAGQGYRIMILGSLPKDS